MTFSKQTLGGVSVVLVLIALGTAVFFRLQELRAGGPNGEGEPVERGAASGPTSADDQFSTQGAVPVVAADVRRDTLWISVTADGRAQAVREAKVAALVRGTIQSVQVRESDPVTPGTTLIRIDSTEYGLAVARAESELRSAEAKYLQTVLFDEEIEDAALREERERIARSVSGFDQAKVALAEAELALDRTRVRAPFASQVANLKVVAGQFVNEGTELLTLVTLNPIKVEAQVLEKDLGLLTRGRRGKVSFTALPGESFEARLESINPLVDPETGSARVTLYLENRDGRIKPGMYARVSLEAQFLPDRILVPREALLERDRRPMLFVVRQDGDLLRSEWRYVTPGRENESFVEILQETETQTVVAGEKVLVAGHTYLIHDAVIRLEESLTVGQGRPGR